MGYDGKIFRPDFQANQSLPTWVPGMDSDKIDANAGAATTGFVDALKARMMGGQQGGGHDMMHADVAPPMAPHEITGPVAGEHGLPLASGAVGGAAKAGGPQSL